MARIDMSLSLVVVCLVAACTEPPRSGVRATQEEPQVEVALTRSVAAEAIGIHLVTILSTRLTPGSYPVMMRHIDFQVAKSLKGSKPATGSLSFWVDESKSWDPLKGDAALLVLRDAPAGRGDVTLFPSTPENIEVASDASR